MSTNLEYRAREIQGKREVGGRQAKVNEKKKGDRDLGRRKKNKGGIFFVERTTKKFCSSGDKIRNASGHKCRVKMSGSEKSEREHVRHFLHKTCN